MDNVEVNVPPTKKSRNTNYCCVPQCSQYFEDGISMHTFPKDGKMRQKWEVALKMGKPSSSVMRVCSRHFLPSDYFPGSKIKRKLFPNSVPSQNIPKRTHDKEASTSKKNQEEERQMRRERRTQSSNLSSSATNSPLEVEAGEGEASAADQSESDQSLRVFVLNAGMQVNLGDFREVRPDEETDWLADILARLVVTEKCTQVNFLPLWSGKVPNAVTKRVTLPDLLDSDETLFTFTGIHKKELLETLVECVGELTVDEARNKKILSVRDRVILSMVKIKQNMSFSAIGVLFGINRQTCSNYFKNMVPLLAQVLKTVIPWPDQEIIRSNLPKSFKNYKDTRIILDCAETEIEKCKCLKCRVLTYSQYKKTHTVKFNVGIAPSGLITEISVPYGGRASDKRIVNESKILDKLDYKDGVMVDKGYRIEKECDERYLRLIRPPFLKNQKQMSREDALQNAEIARARVHVERVIQRLRQYEFLHGPVPWPLAPYFEDILTICAGVTNLGPPVMNIDKFM